jgi:DNA polymerase III alpha subunit
MAFVNISDETKAIKLTLWPGTYSKYKDILKNNDTYVFDISNEAKGIICNGLEKI